MVFVFVCFFETSSMAVHFVFFIHILLSIFRLRWVIFLYDHFTD